MFDPEKAELLERGILANLALGEIEVAAGLADRMVALDLTSQIAHMALIARDEGLLDLPENAHWIN